MIACSVLTSLDGLAGGGADGGSEASGADGALGPGDDAPVGGGEGGVGPDGGADTGASIGDAAGVMDASGDTGTGPAPDTGPPSPFANLVQIDVSALLSANTVETTQQPDSGAPLVWADGVFGQHDFATASEVDAVMPGAGLVGLPDTALFTGDGKTIPTVQLAWSNGLNKENCLILQNDIADAGATSSLTFAVPKGTFHQLQIYVTGTHGTAGVASNLAVVLGYSDRSSSARTVVVPAWDADLSALDAGAGEHVLAGGLAAVDGPTGAVNTGFRISIFAIDLDPDPSKSLEKVSMVDRGGDPSQYGFETVVFYGATAW